MIPTAKKLIKRMLGIKKKTSNDILDDLRRGGADIGEDVYIYSVEKTLIDRLNPYLLKIGNHVRIAEGTKILTHDYAWSVLKHYSEEGIRPGVIFGAQSAVEIGDHVFIGMNCIITRGVKIGSNVIIGAGSIVTRDCPSNGLYAGNPARFIMSMEEYYEKRRKLQFAEAKGIALKYRERFHCLPDKEVFSEYFMLFSTCEEAMENCEFRKKMELLGNYEESVSYMKMTPPMFDGYEAFLSACYEEEE